jgi:hypothetical protein
MDDIVSHHGLFRDSPQWTREKGFFFTVADAAKFARRFSVIDEVLHIVVFADAPAAVVELGRAHIAAQEGPGVYLPVASLYQLSTASKVTW